MEELPELNDNQPKLDIKKIAQADQEDQAREETHLDKNTKNNKKNTKILTITASIIAIGTITAAIFLNPFNNEKQEVGQGSTVKADTEVNVETNNNKPSNRENYNEGLPFWAQGDGLEYPVKTETWQLERHFNQDPTVTHALLAKHYKDTDFMQAAQTLPSESNGFTSDPTKINLPDGTLNPAYTAMTQEKFQGEILHSIERLINPQFGRWDQYQYDNLDNQKHYQPQRFADMFTNQFNTNCTEKIKEVVNGCLPIYADWNNKDYGLKETLLQSGPRWMGEIKEINTNLNYNKETLNYEATTTINLTYKAWTKDQNIATKNATMKLKFITDINKDQAKMLINEAQLEVN